LFIPRAQVQGETLLVAAWISRLGLRNLVVVVILQIHNAIFPKPDEYIPVAPQNLGANIDECRAKP